MKVSANICIIIGFIVGILTPLFPWHLPITLADVTASLFIKSLKLISLPILFLSVVATFAGMSGLKEMRTLGFKVFRYTLLTTLLAAFTALTLFFLIQPVVTTYPFEAPAETTSYLETFLGLFPENLFAPFISGNAMGVVLIAFALGSAILILPTEQKESLHKFFSALFQAFLQIAKGIIFIIPIGIWAFSTQFVEHIAREGLGAMRSIFYYAAVIILANLIQGIIVLPLILRSKGISPRALFKSVSSALSVAFFSKSSNATLPLTLKAMQEEGHASKNVAGFSLPLCSTINMNGCAAFILVTVMFVAGSYGWTFSILEGVMWAMIATFLAVGNAGVPMGCYFLSSMLLGSMGVPLTLLGMILPIYSIIDMIETALNVWSDCCVTAIVDKEIKAPSTAEIT